MLEAGVSAFELGECLHVRFVSFRFALKGFAWRQTAARCFTVSQSPKTLSCARVWLKKKTECYTLCFSHIFQGFFGLVNEPVKPSTIEDHSVETINRSCFVLQLLFIAEIM